MAEYMNNKFVQIKKEHDTINLNECDDIYVQLVTWIREIEEQFNVIFTIDFKKEYGKMTITDLDNFTKISVKNHRAVRQDTQFNYSLLAKQLLDIRCIREKVAKGPQKGTLSDDAKAWIKEAFIAIKTRNQGTIITKDILFDEMQKYIAKDDKHDKKTFKKVKLAINSNGDELDLEDILS